MRNIYLTVGFSLFKLTEVRVFLFLGKFYPILINANCSVYAKNYKVISPKDAIHENRVCYIWNARLNVRCNLVCRCHAGNL